MPCPTSWPTLFALLKRIPDSASFILFSSFFVAFLAAPFANLLSFFTLPSSVHRSFVVLWLCGMICRFLPIHETQSRHPTSEGTKG